MMPAPMFGRVAAVLAPLVTFLVTFLVAAPIALSPALGQNAPLPTQVVRRELRIGARGVTGVLEPGAALEGTSPLIARQVFDTLVAWRDGSTEIEPALATRWNSSRDGLVWSFALREGVKFHDGSPLTAQEVAASFERQLKPEAQGANRAWPALLRGMPGVIKEVRAANSRTVEIVLVQPYAPLLTVLAHPALSIAKPSAAADGAGRLIGSGPYRGGGPRARSRRPGCASDIWPSRPRRSPSLSGRSVGRSPRRSIRRSSARRWIARPSRSNRSCLPVCGGVGRAPRFLEAAGRR